MSARPPTFYAWVSVATSVVVIALKFAAYFLTGSVGLLSDAVESVVNIFAALIALAVLTYASEKPDHEHNFGHEKAEYFSSGIEGALIFVAAGAIVWTSVPRLLVPQPLDQVWLGLALSFVASLANAACAMVMLRAAKAHRSITLEADARHLLTDVWTTILWTGWHLMRRSFDGLMDRAIPDEDRAVITGILDELRRQGGDYHALRTRVAGAKSFVNVHILVPGSMSVQDGHDLLEKLEGDIAAKLPHVEVLTHLEPLEDPKSWDDPDKPLAGT